jgi:hypothetical protein
LSFVRRTEFHGVGAISPVHTERIGGLLGKSSDSVGLRALDSRVSQ